MLTTWGNVMKDKIFVHLNDVQDDQEVIGR